MARILFFLFLAFLVWLAVRTLGGSRKVDRSGGARPAEAAAPPGIETVTQCAWCGVHVPNAQAVALADGRVYCSEAHREAARQVAPPPDRGRP